MTEDTDDLINRLENELQEPKSEKKESVTEDTELDDLIKKAEKGLQEPVTELDVLIRNITEKKNVDELDKLEKEIDVALEKVELENITVMSEKIEELEKDELNKQIAKLEADIRLEKKQKLVLELENELVARRLEWLERINLSDKDILYLKDKELDEFCDYLSIGNARLRSGLKINLILRKLRLRNISLNSYFRNYYESKDHSEESVKKHIIVPILKLLGWNPNNRDEVVYNGNGQEYKLDHGRTDFTLRINNKNKVFIEAKVLHVNIDNHSEQLLRYCFSHGVPISVLTNGRIWDIYSSLKEGDWKDRKIVNIDLEKNPEDFNIIIGLLSKENISNGEAKIFCESLERERQKIKQQYR